MLNRLKKPIFFEILIFCTIFMEVYIIIHHNKKPHEYTLPKAIHKNS